MAPIPGRVVRVLVAAGDEVERGPAGGGRRSDEDGKRAQGAPRAGHVKEIVVAPGTPVEAGRVLAVIE